MKKTFKGALAFAFCIVTIFATMLVASAIGAPKAKVGKLTYNSVTISWAKVKDADFYEVQRSTDGKKWTTLNKAVKATSYKDSSKLTAGKSYKYRVRAVEDRVILSDVYSSWSSAVTAKPVPEQVTSLKASSRTHNSVKLTWKKVSGASGYEVQIKNGSSWKSYKKTTSNSLTVSKLTLGKTYQFRVRAYRTVSKKAVYGAVSSVLKTGPYLKAPSTFVLKGVTTSTLKLAWSSVTGAKGYEVYNTVTKKWTNVKTNKTLTVKNLKPGTKYGFIVRAYSGSYDGTKTATRNYITTPAKVSDVKVTSVTDKTITFSWSKATGATGYQPAIYDYATKKWTNIAATTKTSVTVNKLSGAKKYAVRVRAYVKNSNVKDISATAYGSWSSKVDTYTAPAKTSSVKLYNVTTSALSIVWSASSGATSYEYYNPVKKAWVSNGKNTKVTVSGLAAGTKYTFKVRAVVSNIKSAESASYTFTTIPATPGSVKVTAASASSVTFSWGKVTGAAGYQPAIYDHATKKWTNIAATTGTSVTIKDLSPAKKYTVRVRAYVKNSNVKDISATAYGSWSSSVDTYTVPATPKSVYINGISTTSLTLGWSASSGATSYEYYSSAKNAWVSAGSATKVTVSGLSAGTKYTFKVRAKVSNRTSAETASYSFTTLPAAPSGLKVSSINNSSITVAWNAVKGASGYQVEYKKTAASSWTKLAATTSTSAKVSSLSAYTDYQFRVCAYVKNSNVQTIGATSYGAYSSTLNTRTKIGTPSIKATATSEDTITLSWAALTGAVGYTVEKYDTLQNEWMVYDFDSAKWNYYEYLSDDSDITTTELSFADKGKYTTRSDVYRVIAVDKDGYTGTSSSVTGYTSDIKITLTDYDITLELPVIAEMNQYQIYIKNPDNTTELLHEVSTGSLSKSGNRYIIKLNFAPASYHTILIIGKSTSTSLSTKVTDWLTFRTKDLKLVTSTSDSNYNASVNSQLLYLARAINNTKAYEDTITVKNQSEVSYSIDSLTIKGLILNWVDANSPEEVEDFFNTFAGEGETISAKETEKLNTTLTFKDGKCTTAGNTNTKLKLFIEPTSNSTKTAYLYNGLTSQSAWKNGFESVSTTKNSDGSYTIKAVLKQESANTNYHSGFISSFNMSDFSGDGFEMKSFKVGKSTLNAVIDSEGYLKSYSADSKYSAELLGSFTDSKNGPGTMTMKMSGGTVFNYTVTR